MAPTMDLPMNASRMAALAACCAASLLAGAVRAQPLFQPPAKSAQRADDAPPPSPVLASCNADAGTLTGASRDKFMLECRIQRTSLEDKTKACERNMAVSVSKRVARDPDMRAKFIANCVQRWTPGIK